MARRLGWLAIVMGALAALTFEAGATRLGYPPEEFVARRQALAKALGSGTVVLFGRTEPPAGIRFRQDNDFYYFTGNESLNAAMVMNGATGAATLYLPHQSAGEIRALGRNWLEDPEAGKPWGFDAILPIDQLPASIARTASRATPIPPLSAPGRTSTSGTIRTTAASTRTAISS